MADRSVTVVGAGLAGSEAALRLSRAGVAVDLYEMRPAKLTPAHRSGRFAELVCSNSLGSGELTSGKGLLKEELRILGSALLPIAEASRVPAGKALAVDREEFGRRVTEAVRSCPGIRVHEEEVKAIPGDPLVILACGPLASDAIASAIRDVLGDDGFYFYDAISPIVDAGTIDPEASFVADRYGVGTGDYLNLPMDRERYEAFLSALLTAKTVALRAFEEPRYFEGCMPVEEIARRGPDTLLFGPLRPVGLRDPRTGGIPHAVVQLRKENAAGTMYNLVGFQTRLTYPEQKRVFSLIPGLSSAGYFSIRIGAPQQFPRCPTAPPSVDGVPEARRTLLRGPDHGGRGIRRVDRVRAGRGGFRGAEGRRKGSPSLPAGVDDRRADGTDHHAGSGPGPADERQLRASSRSGGAAEAGPEGAEGGGRARRDAPLRRRSLSCAQGHSLPSSPFEQECPLKALALIVTSPAVPSAVNPSVACVLGDRGLVRA